MASSFSRFQHVFSRYRPPPLLPTTIRTIQILATLHLISTTLVELRICTGFSMLPTLSQHGDCVVVSPLPYWSPFTEKHKDKRPKRGDVVVATSPMDSRQTVCKRVLGIEGDMIEIEPRRGGQRKWIDNSGVGFMVDIPQDVELEHEENKEKHITYKDLSIKPKRNGENQWIKIPKGHVWLVGDNLSNSTDSRKYGPVPVAMVKGKVLARIYPNPTWIENNLKEIDQQTSNPQMLS
ncbi:signal peptidase I [Kwoniella pini CBS 10737]|uniref:Mitochondrial inner membrane protease subunit n=1 Tax=Kwoniella pini CBS 10737 TaxID=1296096 RepID=A0AAJ8KXP7_9TREE